jgi:hypothetical protein
MHTAQQLRHQRPTAEVRTKLEELRSEAAQSGVGAAFDRHLRVLFADVFGTAPMPAVRKHGDVAAGFGGRAGAGAALQFHQLHMQQKPMVGLNTTTPPPVSKEKQFAMQPADVRRVRADMEAELSNVRVNVGGKRISMLDRLRDVPGFSKTQSDRLLDVVAQVKHGYSVVGAAVGDGVGGPAYQEVNWKHTRLEMMRVLDVAAAAGLTPAQTEVALLASAFSDAVKTPGNFLVHNVHGAQAAKYALQRMQPPLNKDMIDDVVRVTLEHQIGPPNFMANVVLRGALTGAKVDSALIASITDKVAHPLDKTNHTPDGTQLSFTAAEHAALAQVGIEAWTVPHAGSRHYAASRAVIDGDSLVNYACPDGWAKLAALHGPGQPPFLQEPLLRDALTSTHPMHASAVKSFHDARSVVSDATKPLYDQGLRRTEMAITRVEQQLTRWVQMQPQVPKTKDGKIPYLTGALDYHNAPQVMFAQRLRDEAVRLLRNEEAL